MTYICILACCMCIRYVMCGRGGRVTYVYCITNISIYVNIYMYNGVYTYIRDVLFYIGGRGGGFGDF